MTFFVLWSERNYIPLTVERFDTEADCIKWLNNKVPGNLDIAFEVIEGENVMFEPVSTVTQFRRRRPHQ